MQTKNTVVYHHADYDGLFSREVAKHFLPTDTLFIGWDYTDPKIDFPAEGKVYVIDLNPECFKEFPGIDVAQERVIWIDHHKTAIEKWGTYLPGYRIEGVAACRLAWWWFANSIERGGFGALAPKEAFVNREVAEPWALTLAGEYDIWDHRGDGDIEFQFGLRTEPKEPAWEPLLAGDHSYVNRLIARGEVAMAYSRHVDAGTVKHRSFMLHWRGLNWLALNTIRCNSQTFAALDDPKTGHDALMAFYWNGRAWNFSLYHAAHRKDLDLSRIAVDYKGGGHPGACGFQVGQIPFPLYPQK